MVKNITYLLGAGASYKAYPILSEQGEKMIELVQIFKKLKENGSFKGNESFKDLERIFDDMEHFGKKAKEFGTIDTYARKLFLNDNRELEKLKVAVSLFFTIWQLTDDKELKTFEKRQALEIDSRYISLLATILEKKDDNIVMKENINFVTWNYDLQLEYAFRKFDNKIKVKNLLNTSPLKICHLNGYHGFYGTSKEENDFLGRTASKKIEDIINEIGFISESYKKGTININNYINYAWEEESKIALNTREEAKKIFKQTDILIIIGYSFPNFNKDIDKNLFQELGQQIEVYYQNPNPTKEFISQLINIENEKIHLVNKLDYFYLPYSF